MEGIKYLFYSTAQKLFPEVYEDKFIYRPDSHEKFVQMSNVSKHADFCNLMFKHANDREIRLFCTSKKFIETLYDPSMLPLTVSRCGLNERILSIYFRDLFGSSGTSSSDMNRGDRSSGLSDNRTETISNKCCTVEKKCYSILCDGSPLQLSDS